MKKILLLLLLAPTAALAQSRPIVPGDVGIQVPFGAVGNLLVAGPATSQVKDSLAFGSNGGLSLGGSVPVYGNCYWNDIDTCTTNNVRLRERVFVGNAALMADTSAGASNGTFFGVTPGASWVSRDAQLLSMTDKDGIAVAGIAQSLNTPASRAAIGLAGVVLNNNVGSKTSWAAYLEGQHNPGTINATTFGMEIDCKNATANNYAGDPYGMGYGCFGLWLAGGGDNSYGPVATNPATAAIVVLNNATTWNAGLVFKAGGVTASAEGNAPAIEMPAGYGLQWYSAAGTKAGFITSQIANTIQLGGLDSATPVTQTLSGQSTLVGTTNTAGANLIIVAGKGTGNQSSGNIFFQTSAGGASGSSQNTPGTTMAINSGAQAVVIFGTATQTAAGGVTPQLQMKANQGGAGPSWAVFNNQNSATSPSQIILALSKSNVVGGQTAVTTGDQLGVLRGQGSDGTAYQQSSAIFFNVDAAVSSGVVPGRIIFQTANVSGTLTESFHVTSSQQIQYPAAVTGTPVASLCLDASNNIIKKTTTGPCI
jgi:hypothetical protein